MICIANVFIYFWPYWVFFVAWALSLVAVMGSYSLVVVCGLLTGVDFLVEHGLKGTRASVVVAPAL